MAEYNGWKNYETWCVSMWLDNDQMTYIAVRDIIEYETTGDVIVVADALRAFVEELPEMVAVTEGPASFVVDLLGAAMSEVDWREIAESILSELRLEA